MTHRLARFALPLCALAATPAFAGPTEDAVAICKAQAADQFPASNPDTELRIRSITPGGKSTRVRIAARSTTRTLDCRVDFRGKLVSATFDERGRPHAVESAARQP